MRPSHRTVSQIRDISITRNFTRYAEGSVLVEFGETKVICTATIDDSIPRFLRGKKQGWLTAEYSMLPRATHTRVQRESSKGKQGGRTLEIQRLIGRSLRAAVDLKALGERQVLIDCDVIQADGGTRTAAITGGCVALYDALCHLVEKHKLKRHPFKQFIAAISAGIYQGQAVLDLDYEEDSNAETDMNIVMTESQGIIEVQGTAENGAYTRAQLNDMMTLAEGGIQELIALQKELAE